MPEPNAGEKQSEFISRCVKVVMDEGRTQQQALGKCYGIWRGKHGGAAKAEECKDVEFVEGVCPEKKKTQDTDFAIMGYEDFAGTCKGLLRIIVRKALQYMRNATR